MPVENPLCEPTLNSILESSSLKWLFVGGKGGVGKTTTSCSLATLLARTPRKTSEGAQRPRRVLIVSTDPAHNVSDAFGQAFTSVPTPVTGVENLDAIEIDPSHIFGSSGQQSTDSCSAGSMSQLKAVLQQAATVLPGIDEISVLVEIMKYVQQLQYDTVVFDTAPTGHTLRLLALPQNLNSTLEKVFEIQGIQQVINMASSFLTGATNSEGANIENLTETLSRWRGHIHEIQEQFTDHSRTAFVCVCIPEFLPVYETERLVQELSKYNINCEHIVVNQVVRKSKSDEGTCRMCDARTRTQSKYLKQIYDLYEDFHVVEMPLNFDEVRGPDALIRFSRYLSEPYNVEVHGYL